MTTTHTYVHGPAISDTINRLPTGSLAVNLGTSATLLFESDAQLCAFVAALTAGHDTLITAEYDAKVAAHASDEDDEVTA